MRLHHVGIVVDSIDEKAPLYRRVVPIGFPSEIIHDEVQRVRVAFADAGNNVALEFIEPDDEDSPVARALRQGASLHHLCYEVEDLEQAVAQARSAGALVVCEPVPARAFQGRRIAFIYSPVGGLTEFVEAR
ncbi:VOC family protein [Dictyobacter aurantiacus]|uniref:Lactoylglutathione lyase n=1 Tax=Dictyobacter aurantiacus TaxID=1936993 RepID=A0A401ZKM6_9CHLR|nr:VOC family protein [Dictyobacter aurantiacus]GCE07382.1 lactoylglutathione lyase [Dictyobacter aurantiacus]